MAQPRRRKETWAADGSRKLNRPPVGTGAVDTQWRDSPSRQVGTAGHRDTGRSQYKATPTVRTPRTKSGPPDTPRGAHREAPAVSRSPALLSKGPGTGTRKHPHRAERESRVTHTECLQPPKPAAPHTAAQPSPQIVANAAPMPQNTASNAEPGKHGHSTAQHGKPYESRS
jgi:hypothetical protein